jgi:hypothetical protein
MTRRVDHLALIVPLAVAASQEEATPHNLWKLRLITWWSWPRRSTRACCAQIARHRAWPSGASQLSFAPRRAAVAEHGAAEWAAPIRWHAPNLDSIVQAGRRRSHSTAPEEQIATLRRYPPKPLTLKWTTSGGSPVPGRCGAAHHLQPGPGIPRVHPSSLLGRTAHVVLRFLPARPLHAISFLVFRRVWRPQCFRAYVLAAANVPGPCWAESSVATVYFARRENGRCL